MLRLPARLSPMRLPAYAAAAATAAAVLTSCASIGRPSGGPRDEDPPRYVRSSPAPGATGFTGNRITIDFDELINVKDAFTKVVVSPPGDATPRVSSLGRRVTVDFPDTLLPATTYTIDFGNAIEDNNEGNKLENYRFSFSTGPQLDSLTISGMVLGAADLEPMQGIYVGLHSSPADSLFRTRRFERIAKTDDYGRFVISGLAAGVYRAYALLDMDGDLRYSSPEETIAFQDITLSPSAERITVNDTILDLRTGETDTITERVRTRFLPNNVLLRSFTSDLKQQYVTSYERPDSARIQLIFNSRALQPPTLAIGGTLLSAANSVTERSAGNDSITVWLRDPALIAADTLRLTASYLRPDSAMAYHPVTDTLRLIRQRPRTPAPGKVKKKQKEEKDTVAPPAPVIRLTAQGGTQEVNRPFVFSIPTPPARLDTALIHLQAKARGDSLWADMPTPAISLLDSLNPRVWKIMPDWKYDTDYRFAADTLAVTDIYGIPSAPFSIDFRTRPESEYARIRFRIEGVTDSIPLYVELLSGGDKACRTAAVDSLGIADFPFLTAGKYNARIVFDRNGNGRWDAGNFDTGLLPDLVYYYPKTVNLKQNWSQDLTWDVFATPVDRQKPLQLVKNKPKDQPKANAAEEEEEEDPSRFDPSDPFGTGAGRRRETK